MSPKQLFLHSTLNTTTHDYFTIGFGGRETRFCLENDSSPLCTFVAPGNAGTAAIATNVPISRNRF
jgi:hypothetical protein